MICFKTEKLPLPLKAYSTFRKEANFWDQEPSDSQTGLQVKKGRRENRPSPPWVPEEGVHGWAPYLWKVWTRKWWASSAKKPWQDGAGWKPLPTKGLVGPGNFWCDLVDSLMVKLWLPLSFHPNIWPHPHPSKFSFLLGCPVSKTVLSIMQWVLLSPCYGVPIWCGRGLEMWLPGFRSLFNHESTHPCLSLLICKMRMIIARTS
jgi:hypothetical protein